MSRLNLEASRISRSTQIQGKRRAVVSVDSTAGALTILASMVSGGFLVRDPNGAARSDVMPTAALLIAAMPWLAVGDFINFTIINNADAAELITLTAGTGMTFGAAQRTHTIAQNAAQSYSLQITGIAAGSESYVLYEK